MIAMELPRAEALISRAAKSGRPFGVFLVDGRAFAATEGTREHVTYVRKPGAVLVGYYDGLALPDQIIDDIDATRCANGKS